MARRSTWFVLATAWLWLVACGDESSNDDMNQGVMMTPGGSGGAAAPTSSTGGTGASAGSSAIGSAAGSSALAGSGGSSAGSGAAGSTAGSSGTDAAGTGGATSQDGGTDEPMSSDACTRDGLKANVDAYFAAIKAHDAGGLPLADGVKFTENGKTTEVGEGFWKTAGDTKLVRSAIDLEQCTSVSEAVIVEGSSDIVFGLRLKLEAQKITEIETIVVRSGDYFSNPMALANTKSDDWETVLPESERATREDLQMIVEKYFSLFPAGACKFADDCTRFENGFSPGGCSAGLSCSDSATGGGRGGMETRLQVTDVEAGIAIGFTMFAGQYTDFHMFKVRDGEVHGVHAILAEADSSGWE